jgi:hypothetical protein
MSTAIRAGTDRDALKRAAANQASDDRPDGRNSSITANRRPPPPGSRIVIIGAGFGDLSAATGLGRATAGSVPLSRFRQSRHDRPPLGGSRFRLVALDRPPRLAGLGCGAHLLPDRVPQPDGGGDRLAVVVRAGRRSLDHRHRVTRGPARR